MSHVQESFVEVDTTIPAISIFVANRVRSPWSFGSMGLGHTRRDVVLDMMDTLHAPRTTACDAFSFCYYSLSFPFLFSSSGYNKHKKHHFPEILPPSLYRLRLITVVQL